MQQLVQKLNSGEMTIQEFPMPVAGAGMIAVRNHYSLISAGTEGSTVKTARKNLIGKAKERPQQVKQVLNVLKRQGPVQTYRAVMKKLDAYSPLGYSSAGEVIEVGDGVREFAVGDKAACAGVGYANHAEVVCAPINLCVKLPDDADLKSACYNTLGAIALQGIRQAELSLGENCAVIGLGLLGQLTCMMLRASGVTALGIDIDSAAVESARKHCADAAWLRSEAGVAEQIASRTGGLGVDAVIIAAGTTSLDPINFAGEIARKKGRVIVLGAVPTGFDRDPHYYRKELDLRMSCSYGPGRYDLDYEEKGLDYPAAYVRWTENRNMQAFQRLAYSGKIELERLTTHEYPFDEAPKAYDMLVDASEPFLGIVLKYNVEKTLIRTRLEITKRAGTGKVEIGFIGVGNYALGSLLPNLPKNDADIICRVVIAPKGTASKRAAERFGFQFCSTEPSDIFAEAAVNTVFIATRHDSHAEYVIRALKAGKNVYVEKPLCLTVEDLDEIRKAYEAARTEFKEAAPQLMIGFNRRFAPLTLRLKQRLGDGPMSMIYRVNAGAIQAGSWYQDPLIGGGRLLGEVGHFVDYLTFMCGALPTRVQASVMPDANNNQDTAILNLEFADGSIGVVCYFANGSSALTKEYVEIHQSGSTGILRDFKQLEMYSGTRTERKRLWSQDKGQAHMIKSYLQRIKEGGEPLIAHAEIFAVTQAMFSALESLKTRRSVSI